MGRQTNRGRRVAADRTARERAAAMRAQQKRRERRGKALRIGAGVVVVAGVGGGITAAVLAKGSGPTGALPVAAISAASHAGTGQPPWPRPADTTQRAAAAGLQVGAGEGTAVHFHVHLDILVNGSPVAVPADLGIGSTSLAELHTHDATGVLHIEAPASGRFVLGQLFDEWNVRLDGTHLGALTNSPAGSLAAYVNGQRSTVNPAAIELKPHEEIALVFGPATQQVKVPSHYSFPNGL